VVGRGRLFRVDRVLGLSFRGGWWCRVGCPAVDGGSEPVLGRVGWGWCRLELAGAVRRSADGGDVAVCCGEVVGGGPAVDDSDDGAAGGPHDPGGSVPQLSLS
jgi:hypothetical protein